MEADITKEKCLTLGPCWHWCWYAWTKKNKLKSCHFVSNHQI